MKADKRRARFHHPLSPFLVELLPNLDEFAATLNQRRGIPRTYLIGAADHHLADFAAAHAITQWAANRGVRA